MREENMVAVIPFTRGAPTVVEGCLDVRRPRLPLARRWFLGGEACADVLEETMMLREVLCELLVQLVLYLLAGHPSARVKRSLST